MILGGGMAKKPPEAADPRGAGDAGRFREELLPSLLLRPYESVANPWSNRTTKRARDSIEI
jgi:hypothetical protein